MSRLGKALLAFVRTLAHEACLHENLQNHGGKAQFCPDCGEKVRFVWVMVQCKGCSSKRYPKYSLEGSVEPYYKHCRHCGSSEFRVIKKTTIDGFEMPYSLSVKEVDETETAAPHRPVFEDETPGMRRARTTASHNPFFRDIVEGEVVRKQFIG